MSIDLLPNKILKNETRNLLKILEAKDVDVSNLKKFSSEQYAEILNIIIDVLNNTTFTRRDVHEDSSFFYGLGFGVTEDLGELFLYERYVPMEETVKRGAYIYVDHAYDLSTQAFTCRYGYEWDTVDGKFIDGRAGKNNFCVVFRANSWDMKPPVFIVTEEIELLDADDTERVFYLKGFLPVLDVITTDNVEDSVPYGDGSKFYSFKARRSYRVFNILNHFDNIRNVSFKPAFNEGLYFTLELLDSEKDAGDGYANVQYRFSCLESDTSAFPYRWSVISPNFSEITTLKTGTYKVISSNIFEGFQVYSASPVVLQTYCFQTNNAFLMNGQPI